MQDNIVNWIKFYLFLPVKTIEINLKINYYDGYMSWLKRIALYTWDWLIKNFLRKKDLTSSSLEVFVWSFCINRTDIILKTYTIFSGFEFAKQNHFANSKRNKKKGLPHVKIFLDLWIILWKMRRVLTNFYKVIWLCFAN